MDDIVQLHTTRDMFVVKRNNAREEVSFDKVLTRLRKLSSGLDVNFFEVAQKVCTRIYDGVKTSELDELAAQICSSQMVEHPDYGELAVRVAVSNHQKNTSPSFSETITLLYENVDNGGRSNPLVSRELYDIVMHNKEKLNSSIKYDRDYLFDYFGFRTLEKAYLLRIGNRVIERPQHMWMRVALGIHGSDVKDALNTYELMSCKYFVHATPTLFNAGTSVPQMSSCYLYSMHDSIDGIFSSLKDCAHISKYAGGIGLHIHNVRARNSVIRGTNGTSCGILPMLRVFNNTARYVNQSGRRNGSIAMYLEPWHADIECFLDMRKNHGNEEERARDLFYALWIPDLFMKRVKANEMWSLMCPDACPGLSDTFGDDFETLYTSYELEKRFVKQVRAQDLWFQILQNQIETGTPYMLYKDSVNRKNNQSNLGVIKSSNLCVAPETMILTDRGYHEIASLHGQKVNVWNGEEFSETVVRKTGVNQPLITVKFDNGQSIRCTPYHKFYIETGKDPARKSKPVVVQAKDLTLKARIIKFSLPVLSNDGESLPYAYTQGLFAAEGTYEKMDENNKHRCTYTTKNNMRHQNFEHKFFDEPARCATISYIDKPKLYLYGEKKNLLQHIDWLYYNPGTGDRFDVGLKHDIKDKFFVPINYDLQSRLAWFAGLCDGDGSVADINGAKNIQIASVEHDFLRRVSLMLQTLGVNASIGQMHAQGPRWLPDQKGEVKDCQCKAVHRMIISCADLHHLVDIGFRTHRLDFENIRKPQINTKRFVKVAAVEDNGDVDDTYCFNEPKRHMGIFNGIIASNCTEICEYSDATTCAVCNLASLVLPTFVKNENFDFEKFATTVKTIVKNLNKVIDRNFYPIEQARFSNKRDRPIGIGVQGLADVFAKLKLPFESPEARKLNRQIFECMYFAALQESCTLAQKHGAYQTFPGSPASDGVLQFDMWKVQPSNTYNWQHLRDQIKTHGLRNSLLIAPMPTASTAQIMGSTEAFEPLTSNLYKRKTLAGEFIVVNKYLVEDLRKLGLWTHDIRQKIIIGDGSIQHIPEIPEELRALYKTVWEVKMRSVIDMAADRGAFVDQSQSMNLFVEAPDYPKLTSMHFYAWEKGLKTGMYYLRSKARAKVQKFTVDPSLSAGNLQEQSDTTVCESCSA